MQATGARNDNDWFVASLLVGIALCVVGFVTLTWGWVAYLNVVDGSFLGATISVAFTLTSPVCTAVCALYVRRNGPYRIAIVGSVAGIASALFVGVAGVGVALFAFMVPI